MFWAAPEDERMVRNYLLKLLLEFGRESNFDELGIEAYGCEFSWRRVVVAWMAAVLPQGCREYESMIDGLRCYDDMYLYRLGVRRPRGCSKEGPLQSAILAIPARFRCSPRGSAPRKESLDRRSTVQLFQVSTTHPAIPTAPVRRPRGCSKEGPLQSAIPARFCSKEAKSGAADRKVRSSPPSPPSPRGSALVSQSPPPLSSLGRHHGRSAHQPRRSHQPRPTHQPRKSPTCRKSPPSIHGSRALTAGASWQARPYRAPTIHGSRAPTVKDLGHQVSRLPSPHCPPSSLPTYTHHTCPFLSPNLPQSASTTVNGALSKCGAVHMDTIHRTMWGPFRKIVIMDARGSLHIIKVWGDLLNKNALRWALAKEDYGIIIGTMFRRFRRQEFLESSDHTAIHFNPFHHNTHYFGPIQKALVARNNRQFAVTFLEEQRRR
uniref:Uncharacterized protein n=1 Tax=Zea mays TaxID=4577 RepID=A0A804NNM9_MAIZE